MYWGLGLGTGSIIGGHMIHTVGPHWTFRTAASGSFIIALLFGITQWRWQRESMDDSLEIYSYFSLIEPQNNETMIHDNENDKILKNMKTKSNNKTDKKGKNKNKKRFKQHDNS